MPCPRQLANSVDPNFGLTRRSVEYEKPILVNNPRRNPATTTVDVLHSRLPSVLADQVPITPPATAAARRDNRPNGRTAPIAAPKTIGAPYRLLNMLSLTNKVIPKSSPMIPAISQSSVPVNAATAPTNKIRRSEKRRFGRSDEIKPRPSPNADINGKAKITPKSVYTIRMASSIRGGRLRRPRAAEVAGGRTLRDEVRQGW
jgi:hypothetical protein